MISLTKIKTLRDVAIEQVERLKRNRHPDGDFKKSGVYWLTKAEYCKCCRKQYSPTKKYPHRLSSHARTIEHVANRYNVDPKALRKEIKAYRKTLSN
ncbi:MAG: hypothetical protein RPR97_13600 [Colwellia sp.]|jgi:hypothetical protein